MSNIIDFLARVGSDSRLRHAGAAQLGRELDLARIDQDLQAAILAGDQARLEAVLGARTNVICGLSPAEQDDAPAPVDDDEEIRRVAGVG